MPSRHLETWSLFHWFHLSDKEKDKKCCVAFYFILCLEGKAHWPRPFFSFLKSNMNKHSVTKPFFSSRPIQAHLLSSFQLFDRTNDIIIYFYWITLTLSNSPNDFVFFFMLAFWRRTNEKMVINIQILYFSRSLSRRNANRIIFYAPNISFIQQFSMARFY